MIFQAHTMSSNQEHCRATVLHDYQNAAPARADWPVWDALVPVTVFNDHLADADALVMRLQPFDMVCVMRKRTPMTSSIIERLPRLRLIASTAMRNAPVDLRAAEEHGVRVAHTGYTSAPTIRRTHLSAQGKLMSLAPSD
jgi:lactate dehydrogenase-like 2-hydroxyacid dehydrogenase